MDFYVHLSRPGSRVKNRKLKVGKVGDVGISAVSCIIAKKLGELSDNLTISH